MGDALKAKKHWIFDDNIEGCTYVQREQKLKIPFRQCILYAEKFEDHVVEEIGILSFNYASDVASFRHQFAVNTKNYSGLLINHALLDKNDLFWQGKFNEDVNLTLDCIQKRIRTCGLNQFLINKLDTGKLKGGNTGSNAYQFVSAQTSFPIMTSEEKEGKKAFEAEIDHDAETIRNKELFHQSYERKWAEYERRFPRLKCYRGFHNKYVAAKHRHPNWISITAKHKNDDRPHHKFNYKKFQKGIAQDGKLIQKNYISPTIKKKQKQQ